MIAQVSALYPVKGSLGQSPGENLHSSSDGSKSGLSSYQYKYRYICHECQMLYLHKTCC